MLPVVGAVLHYGLAHSFNYTLTVPAIITIKLHTKRECWQTAHQTHLVFIYYGKSHMS